MRGTPLQRSMCDDLLLVLCIAIALDLFDQDAATFGANEAEAVEERGEVRQRGGPVFRNRMAALLRWILSSITPPISPRLPA
jgi:hypothetical protein